jgi:hypothetical protein
MDLLATALACLAMTPGCGGPAPAEMPPVASFAISYERSGGLKPMPRKLVIEPGRRGQVFQAPNGHESGARIFRVGKDSILSLRRSLTRAHFEQIESGGSPGTCADCYLYSIRYLGHSVSLVETEVPARLRPVIDRLEAVIDAHLPFH